MSGATQHSSLQATPKWRGRFLIGLPILLVVIGLAAWFGLRREPWPVQPAYRTAIASRGPIVAEVRAAGLITPRSEIVIPAPVSGRVTMVTAEVNAAVKNGQVLARLDDREARQRLLAAQAELTEAKARRALLQAKHTATTEGGEAAAPPVEQADFNLADAAVLVKEARVAQCELELSQLSITSPIDGLVLQRSVEVGQTVEAGKGAPLFKIGSELHSVIVRAEVEEAEIGGVRVGQEARVSVAALPGRNLTGHVKAIELDPQTSSRGAVYVVQVQIDNQRLELLPGMSAQVDLLGERRADVLRIPNEALRWQPSAVLLDSRDNPILPWGDDGATADNDPAGPFGNRGRAGFGPGRVMLDRFRNDLRLSDQQTQQIEGIVATLRQALGDPRLMEPDERRQKLREFRTKLVEGIDPLLRPDQKAKFIEFRQNFIDTGRDRPGGVPGRVFMLDKGVPRRIDLRLGVSDGRQTELLAGNLPPDALLIIGGGPPPLPLPPPPATRPVLNGP